MRGRVHRGWWVAKRDCCPQHRIQRIGRDAVRMRHFNPNTQIISKIVCCAMFHYYFQLVKVDSLDLQRFLEVSRRIESNHSAEPSNMSSETVVGFNGSGRAPSALASAPHESATLKASKYFAAQHNAKLPSAGCKLSTVVTESDVSRWEASLDTDAATLLAQHEDVADRVLPDIAAAILRQECASDVSQLCPIAPFAPSSVAVRSNAKQLTHRSKWLPYRQKVPVYQQRSGIVSSVRDARVVTIVGGPHSGKSTQVPQLLAETDLFRKKRIIVATATPMGAVLLAKRLREEKGDTAPSIAHCIPLSTSDCTQASQIVVTTYDVLFRSLITDVRMQDVGCVVLDDLHTHATVFMDLCLSLLRDLLAHPTANKDLRLVINCRDDVVESSLLQYLQPVVAAGHKADRHVIPDAAVPSSAVLYLDDAAQWLQKSDAAAGNAALVHDAAAELGDVANNVQVLARVLDSDNAGDVIKSNVKGLESYWLPLLRDVAATYDVAEKTLANAIVVILPTAEVCAVVQADFQKHLSGIQVVVFLAQLTPAAMEDAALQLSSAMSGTQRVAILTTPMEVVSTTLIPFKHIGCLIDLCRQDRVAYDTVVEADRWVVGETVSKAALRDHRLLLHGNPAHTMSIQLVSRQTLHSQRTKQNAPHPLTTASLDTLLAVTSFAYLRAKKQQQGGSLGVRLAKYVSATCWDANPNQLRGDSWQKCIQQSELLLQHLGALDGKCALTGLGVGSLALGLPWQVSRLLLFGGLFAPSAALSVTLLAATWIVGDVFDGDKDECGTQDAKKFFLGSHGEDIAVPVNAFSMWRRTVRQTPADEDEFLATAHLCKDRLVEVQRLHLELLRRVRQSGLVNNTISEASIATIEKVDDLLASQADVAHDAALKFCATGAVHPNVTFFNKSGALGIAKLMETPTAALLPVGIVTPRGALPAAAPVQIAVSKVGAASGTHVELTTCGGASLPAAVVCCGVGVRQPLSPPTRSRGWMSALTNTWRQTNAARHLPPPPQIAARTVPVKFYNPTPAAPVVLELDGAVNVQTGATTAALLAKIRDFSKRKLATMISLKETGATSVGRSTLEEVLQWLDERQNTQEDFLRDRREHVPADQNSGPQLLPFLTYNDNYERPALIHVTVQSLGAGTQAAGAAVGQDTTSHVVVATALTFTGVVPPDQATQALIRRTAETIGKNANRDGEASFAERDTFAFVRQDHPYHEYYLHILKKEAPHLDWLGDDLVELEKWLQDLERQIEKDADAAYQQQYGVDCVNPPQYQDASAYEEVSEEQFAAELQRQHEAEEAARKAADEEHRKRQAANATPFVPKPGSTLQFLSPDASAQGVGSGTLHGGNTLLQSLMAMRGGAPSAPAVSELTGPAAGSAASIFGNIPGVPPPPPQAELSASELLAIIGGGVGGSAFGETAQPTSFYNATPAMKAHPLTIPPPPLPSDAVQNRSPSVIVEPLPIAPGMNLPLVLAKALGETLDMKVGPTLIIGDVARIEVPSSSVESRAIALKHFYCLGSKLTIIKNDRIIDNPSRTNSSRIMELKERLHGGRGRGGYNNHGSDNYSRGRGRGGGRGGRGGSSFDEDAPARVTSFVPATVGAGYLQPPQRIGVFDDEE